MNPRITPRPAVRKGQKLRLAIDGPTGSGKTWTALMFARTFATSMDRVLFIDTERGSSQLYADEFPGFIVAEWVPPFDPRELRTCLNDWQNSYEVIVVDSLSHFWEGEGGTLDIVDTAATRQYSGNRFAGWKDGTPAQNDMVSALVACDAHIIVTMRSKMEYVLDEQRRPQKVGMAPIQRGGLEYEFTVVADMDLSHTMSIGKSRCHAIADGVYRMGHTQECIDALADWLGHAEPMVTAEQLAEMNGLVSQLFDEEAQKAARAALRAQFGDPRTLTEADAGRALVFLRAAVADALEPLQDAPESTKPDPSGEPTSEVVHDEPAAAQPVLVYDGDITVEWVAEQFTADEITEAFDWMGWTALAKAKGPKVARLNAALERHSIAAHELHRLIDTALGDIADADPIADQSR